MGLFSFIYIPDSLFRHHSHSIFFNMDHKDHARITSLYLKQTALATHCVEKAVFYSSFTGRASMF